MSAAIGCRARSGWATLVVVCGPIARPELTVSRRVELTAHGTAEEKQPYHAGAELPIGKARRLIDGVTRAATRLAQQAVADLAADVGDVTAFGMILGSGKGFVPVEPQNLDTVLASHALLHGAEGEMFRDVMVRGAEQAGLAIVGTTESELPKALSRATGLADAAMIQHVAETGKPLGPPWTQHEKLAAMAGWLALAQRT